MNFLNKYIKEIISALKVNELTDVNLFISFFVGDMNLLLNKNLYCICYATLRKHKLYKEVIN